MATWRFSRLGDPGGVMATGVSDLSSSSSTSSSSYSSSSADAAVGYPDAFGNYPLVCALVAFAVAQSIKVVTTWYTERRWDLKQLIGSGGMPSSHSSTVAALAMSIGLQDGFGGSSFAIAAILASVVMYDASGVRLHAGRQAMVLNQIIDEFPEEHPLSDTRPLREVLGHTPIQVTAGGLLGVVISLTGYLIMKAWTLL